MPSCQDMTLHVGYRMLCQPQNADPQTSGNYASHMRSFLKVRTMAPPQIYRSWTCKCSDGLNRNFFKVASLKFRPSALAIGIVSGRYIPRTGLGIRSLQLSWSSSQVNSILMTSSRTTGVTTILTEYVPNPVKTFI